MPFRCGNGGQNEEREQFVQGKTGLLDEIGELRVVHPNLGENEDLGSRRFCLYPLQVSTEREKFEPKIRLEWKWERGKEILQEQATKKQIRDETSLYSEAVRNELLQNKG